MGRLNIQKIEQELGQKNKIEYYKEIGSTHTYAKKIANKQENNGKIIIAETQTKGIGTKGRVWYTGEGKNIALTIIIKPKCQIEKLDGLTIKIAECISQAIYDLYKIKLQIKKPNDLMLNNKKISGILTEINTISEKINYLLISIGFNVNEENFSKEVENIATSLKKEHKDKQEFSRKEIIAEFLE